MKEIEEKIKKELESRTKKSEGEVLSYGTSAEVKDDSVSDGENGVPDEAALIAEEAPSAKTKPKKKLNVEVDTDDEFEEFTPVDDEGNPA